MTSSYKLIAVCVLCLAAGIGIGSLLSFSGGADSGASGEKKIAYWVAPMDPNYRRDEPGKSPMGMDLVPVYEGEQAGAGADEGVVEISPALVNSLGVRSVSAQKRTFTSAVRTVGYVGFNEDKTSHIHVREDGWIENLVVRSEGANVSEGDLLFDLFSREIAAAAYEYIREKQRGSQLGVQGSKAKLLALGMAESQIQEMAQSGKPQERIKVFAPQDGVVVNYNIGDGMFIAPSLTALTITNLSSVWVIADVFESQAGRVLLGMEAVASLPNKTGEPWRGTVDFIYPQLDPVTRTLRVRLKFENPDLTLRPNMFLNISLEGQAVTDVLSIPDEALIQDGTVDRVIRSLGDGKFKAVAVTVGRRANGQVEILRGLEEGDQVVSSAQFLIDSESNLTGALARLTAPANDQKEAAPIVAEGVIHERVSPGKVNVSHAPIPALGWPEMTMHFDLLEGDAALPAALIGTPVTFEVVKTDGGAFAIRGIAAKADAAEPMAWGVGVVNLVGDGLLNMTHEPIPALGWPDMTMDLPVKPGVDLDGIAKGDEIRFGLGKGVDGMFRIEAIEPRAPGDGGKS